MLDAWLSSTLMFVKVEQQYWLANKRTSDIIVCNQIHVISLPNDLVKWYVAFITL